MAGKDVEVELRGIEETARKMEQVVADLQGGPFLEGMRDATLLLTRAVRQNFEAYRSPQVGGVDIGVTRASVTPEVRTHGRVVEGVVGSNRISAAVQETGSRPHWPPLAALETWARRHGTTAYVVARAIARRGNIARRQFSRAFDDNADKIAKLVGDVVGKIVSK
jgi:hypothetical protein